MAEIVGIFGVSHTPVMTNLPDAPDAHITAPVYDCFKRIGREIVESNPDAIVMISDDHLHNFFLDNLPAFCIGAASHYDSPVEGWLKVEKRSVQGDVALGSHLLESVLDAGFDPSLSMELTLDHGMVTPLELAGVAALYPTVPILINCVQPPLPRMRRCIALGAALGEALKAYQGAERIAVLATGGLSHDVGTPRMGFVNEAFDHRFLELVEAGDPNALAEYSQSEVNTAGNGAEEIRNWLVAHGIAGCSGFDLYHYRAVNDWYTGIALGRWRATA